MQNVVPSAFYIQPLLLPPKSLNITGYEAIYGLYYDKQNNLYV